MEDINDDAHTITHSKAFTADYKCSNHDDCVMLTLECYYYKVSKVIDIVTVQFHQYYEC